MQMVSTMINPANVARAGEFGRSGEYIFFVLFGNASPSRVILDREWVSSKRTYSYRKYRWDCSKDQEPVLLEKIRLEDSIQYIFRQKTEKL